MNRMLITRAIADLDCEKISPSSPRPADRDTDRGHITGLFCCADYNCSVQCVAHSYFSPRQRELKLQQFKVTFKVWL